MWLQQRQNTMTNRITDLAFLKQNSFGDADIYRELLTIFVRTTPEMVAQMQEAINRNDLRLLSQVAHKLKSSIQAVGLHQVSLMLEELEHHTDRKSRIELQKTIDDVAKQCSIAVAEVVEELKL